MTNPYQKVKSGGTIPGIPAALWNGTIDVVNYWQGNGPWKPNGHLGGTVGPVERGIVVPIRNNSGEQRDRWDILRITGFLFAPGGDSKDPENRPSLKGQKPDDSEHQFFVVLQEPIAPDMLGMGMICGVSFCRVLMNDPADRFAIPLDDDATQLESGASGVPILAKSAETGTVAAYVLLGASNPGDTCPDRNEIQHWTIIGAATGGSVDVSLTVNAVQETLTFDWDADASAIEAEIESHSEVGSGNVSVTGGPFPDVTVVVEFVNDLAATAIAFPISDKSNLVGLGLAFISGREQSGYPN